MVSKYKAKKIIIDGYTFDSKVEAKYYEKLKEDKAKGLILNFELQPKFVLQPGYKMAGVKVRSIEYVADFRVYYDDLWIDIIDIKGMATPEAKLKRKIYNYLFPHRLVWLCWSSGNWIEYDELQKLKRDKKKVPK